MKRIPLVDGEQGALRRALQWVESLDGAFDAAGITPRDPAAAPLQRMDKDIETWARAHRRGWHDQVSLNAATRVANWLDELEVAQRTASKRRRPVVRALTL